jgi:hypothetical protein
MTLRRLRIDPTRPSAYDLRRFPFIQLEDSMKRLFLVLPVLLAALTLSTAATAKPSKFSARQDVTMYEGESAMMTSIGHVYAMPDRTRSEMTTNGLAMVTIYRNDQKKGYLLNPANKTYVVLEITPEEEAKNTSRYILDDKADIKKEKVGSEKVGDLKTTKYKNTVTDKETKKETVFYTWESSKYDGLPVKMEFPDPESERRTVVVLSEINDRKVTPDLFEIPAGYTETGKAGMAVGTCLGIFGGK